MNYQSKEDAEEGSIEGNTPLPPNWSHWTVECGVKWYYSLLLY